MKKLIYIVPLLLGVVLTSCYDEDIENINSRLNAIENTKIATISQQITTINNSIQLLTDTDAELKGYIATLEAEAEALEAKLTETIATEKAAILAELEAIHTTIAALKAKDTTLDGQIADLKTYVDTQLKAAEDWATATFATLEQYNALAKDVAALKTYVEGVESTLTASITALEISMKEWVNEQLTGYYTIAEIDAKIVALESAYAESKKDVENDIATLQTELTNAKSELTKAYTAAITEAINANNGVIDAKIATEIATVNEKIAGLEKRLDEIESRLSAVEDAIEQIKALDIKFDTTEKACMAGASVYIGYTITGGDAETAIEAWGDGGWSATVVAEDATKGKIKATAPADATSGKVVVLVTSGAGGVKMKSLHFVEGVLTNISDTYEVDWEACTLTVTLKTNLDYYSVDIPADAQAWISLAETRAAARTETLTFNIAENPEDMPTRAATIHILGECGDVLQSFEVVQNFKPSSNPIEFADPNVKKVCVEKFDTNGDGELSYLESSKVTSLGYYGSLSDGFFGDYTIAIKSFDELRHFTNLTSIGKYAFKGCSSLASVTIPESVTSIEESAFSGCKSLASITIPESVISIGNWVFNVCSSLKDVHIGNIDKVALFDSTSILYAGGANLWLKGELVTEYSFPNGTVKVDSRLRGCTSIAKVTIPDGVTSIGSSAFYNCSSLASITFPDSVISIRTSAFYGCSSLASVTIPDSVTSIGEEAFYNCSSLASVTIGNGVTSIGNHAFYYCTSLASVTIGNGVTSIGNHAFYCCTSLASVTIPESVTSIEESAFSGCTSLASVTIPDSVTSIGIHAFSSCSSLANVYCKPTTPPSIGYYVFDYNASGRKIYVPRASVEAYKAAEGWGDYADSIVGYDFQGQK